MTPGSRRYDCAQDDAHVVCRLAARVGERTGGVFAHMHDVKMILCQIHETTLAAVPDVDLVSKRSTTAGTHAKLRCTHKCCRVF